MSDYNTTMRKLNDLLKVEKGSAITESRTGTPQAGVRGVAGTRQRISNLPLWMAKAARAAALEVGLEGFQVAMQRVPVATGRLARSGKLYVGNRVYARGTYSGGNNTGVDVDEEAASSANFIPTEEDYAALTKGSVNCYIEFNRLDAKGENLAWKLHEDLNEYGSGVSPQASKPGRGPKFVEIPMNEIVFPKLYNAVFRNIQILLNTVEKGKI